MCLRLSGIIQVLQGLTEQLIGAIDWRDWERFMTAVFGPRFFWPRLFLAFFKICEKGQNKPGQASFGPLLLACFEQ